MSDTETAVAVAGKGDAATCFHPEHEEDLALHTALTALDEHDLTFLQGLDKGEAGGCFHPEHEDDLALTALDKQDLTFLQAVR